MPVSGNRPIVLARYLALAWCALIVYASLHPFSGWRSTGVSPWGFLPAAWPRYWTGFDLVANVAVYLPLGFFLCLGLRSLRGRITAFVLATLCGALLSLSLETLQNWLPSRVPSNLDLACNTLGAALGALLGQIVAPRSLIRLENAAQHLLSPMPHSELGLTLLGLWMMVPLSPEILLFGAGDLRQLLAVTPPLPFTVEHFSAIEAGVTACNALAVGLLLRCLLLRWWLAYLLVPLFLAIGLTVRTLAAAVLVSPGEAMLWLTPGAQLGLQISGVALLLTLWLPTRGAAVLALVALLAGTALVNLAPFNPYSQAALATWQQGHFLNFNGLTRLVASLWPLLALPFLVLVPARNGYRST